MRFLIQLAGKNLLRYKKRTFITCSALAAGIAVYVLLDSMIAGSMDMSEINMLKYELGHGHITTEQWWEDKDFFPLEESIPEGLALADQLDSLRGIAAVPRISFLADMIVYQDPFPEDGSMQVTVTAIDPDRDGRVFQLEDTLSKGRWLVPGEEGALMGSWMANEIGADVGYDLILVCRTRDGYYQTLDLEIVGIIDTPNPTVNRISLLLPLDVADDALEQRGGVSEIVLLLAGDREINQKEYNRISDVLPEGLVFHPWKDLAQDYMSASKGDQYSNLVVLFFVFLIAAVGVSNTMLMSAMERTRELGMMRAMGMADRDLGRLFLLESAGIGFMGSAAGVLIGILGNIPIVLRGISLPASMDDYGMGYRISGIVWGVWRPGVFLLSILIGVLIAIFVSRLSVKRILSLSIVEDLRHY